MLLQFQIVGNNIRSKQEVKKHHHYLYDYHLLAFVNQKPVAIWKFNRTVLLWIMTIHVTDTL